MKTHPDPAADAQGQSRSTAELRLESILNAAVDGIVVINEEGRIELFNQAAERIFGYRKEDVIGKSVSILMGEPHHAHHQEYVEKYLRTGKAKVIGIGREAEGRRADGSFFPMDLSVSETVINNHRSFTGLIRDITERKLLEQAIVDASEMERKQMGQDLHDTVSQHLAGLTMLTKVLQNKITHSTDKSVQALASDAHNISELAAIALSQVKNISHGLYPVELERNGLGVALAQLTAQQAALFGIDCVYIGKTEIPTLEPSVAMHLYRIAQEALSNAIKHAKANRIQVNLSASNTNGSMYLEVKDDGCGMPTPPPRNTDGGLGLAIMYYRATMIGYELLIHSRRGQGTKITCAFSSHLVDPEQGGRS